MSALKHKASQRACISSVHSSGIYQIEVTVFLNCSSNLLNNRTFYLPFSLLLRFIRFLLQISGQS